MIIFFFRKNVSMNGRDSKLRLVGHREENMFNG